MMLQRVDLRDGSDFIGKTQLCMPEVIGSILGTSSFKEQDWERPWLV